MPTAIQTPLLLVRLGREDRVAMREAAKSEAVFIVVPHALSGLSVIVGACATARFWSGSSSE